MYLRDKKIKRFSQITTKSILKWGDDKLDIVTRSTLYAYYNSMRSYIKFVRQMGVEVDVDETQIIRKPHHKTRTFVDLWGEPLSGKKAYHIVKKSMVIAVYPNAYPHALRHSFATELLRKGASLSHTRRLIVHANVSITQLYEHLITDDIEKAQCEADTCLAP